LLFLKEQIKDIIIIKQIQTKRATAWFGLCGSTQQDLLMLVCLVGHTPACSACVGSFCWNQFIASRPLLIVPLLQT
jgi:hypothetical protein